MLANPILTRFWRPPPIHTISPSVIWILLTLLVCALPWLRVRPHAKPAVPTPALPAQVEARIPAVGYDRNHRRLPFTVYVLTQQLSWRLRSTDDLEGIEGLFSAELVRSMNEAYDIFCVGTASAEGRTNVEEERAARRAAMLGQWIATKLGPSSNGHPGLFTLNAGQYQGPRDVDSSDQRKAIILITGPHDDQVNLTEGLQSGLEQQQTSPLIHSLLHDYSLSADWLQYPGSVR